MRAQHAQIEESSLLSSLGPPDEIDNAKILKNELLWCLAWSFNNSAQGKATVPTNVCLRSWDGVSLRPKHSPVRALQPREIVEAFVFRRFFACQSPDSAARERQKKKFRCCTWQAGMSVSERCCLLRYSSLRAWLYDDSRRVVQEAAGTGFRSHDCMGMRCPYMRDKSSSLEYCQGHAIVPLSEIMAYPGMHEAEYEVHLRCGWKYNSAPQDKSHSSACSQSCPLYLQMPGMRSLTVSRTRGAFPNFMIVSVEVLKRMPVPWL